MVGNYQDRAIDRYEVDNVVIDTCSVTDSAQPYETGVRHPNYNDGLYVIVEMYDTKEQARKGHDKWVKIMTAETLPDKLVDVSSATVAELWRCMTQKSKQ